MDYSDNKFHLSGRPSTDLEHGRQHVQGRGGHGQRQVHVRQADADQVSIMSFTFTYYLFL